MSTLDQIKEPISQELVKLNELFEEFYAKSEISLLKDVAQHTLNTKGKQIRPIIALLVAKMLQTNIPSEIYNNAIFVELLHLSSLIHDDVVDKADYRRGKKTVSRLWGNSTAVLFGDYLFSKALQKSIQNKTTDLLKLGTQVIINMAKGEFLQKEKSELLDTTEEDYMNIIRWKTGSLLEICVISSALSSEVDAHKTQQLELFGKYLGYMFQMRDDLLDYADFQETGKSTHTDILDRKLTMPVLMAFEHNPAAKDQIIKLIQSDDLPNHVDQVASFVKENKGIEKTYEKLKSLRDKALLILNEFEDSKAKNSLKLLVNYFVDRKK